MQRTAKVPILPEDLVKRITLETLSEPRLFLNATLASKAFYSLFGNSVSSVKVEVTPERQHALPSLQLFLRRRNPLDLKVRGPELSIGS